MGQKIPAREVMTDREIFGAPDLEGSLKEIKSKKFMDFVNVKDFGAKGDGVTDDTESIQNALDTNKNLFFPEGIYLSDKININENNTNIFGYGIDKTIIKSKSGNLKTFDINANNINISNITFNGENQEKGNSSCALINLNNIDYCNIKNIKVINSGYYGINLYECNNMLFNNIILQNNYRHGLHTGTDTDGRNMNNKYINIWAYENGTSGFDDRGNSNSPQYNQNNIYENIHCYNNGQFGFVVLNQGKLQLNNIFVFNNPLGFSIGYIYDSNINNLIVYSNDNPGELKNSKNVNVNNCIFNDHINQFDCFDLYGESDKIFINNSIFKGNANYGFKFRDWIGSGDITIKNSYIENTEYYKEISIDYSQIKLINNEGGYKTSNKGTATILSGETSVIIPHGLIYTPNKESINIQILGDLKGANYIYPTNSYSNDIQVECDTPPTGDITFAWQINDNFSGSY